MSEFKCEPQHAVTEDGFCEWVCPKPTGYLMQCCDCDLIHEVEFRVAKYEPRPSEVFEVVSDPNLQVQLRAKRRDDLSEDHLVVVTPEMAKVGLEEFHSFEFGEDPIYVVSCIYRAMEYKRREKP